MIFLQMLELCKCAQPIINLTEGVFENGTDHIQNDRHLDIDLLTDFYSNVRKLGGGVPHEFEKHTDKF